MKKLYIPITLIVLFFSSGLSATGCEVFTQEKNFFLLEENETIARQAYPSIRSPLFFIPFLKNKNNVRNFLLSPHGFKGQPLQLKQSKVNAFYFNRNSDRLIIMAAGFGVPKEYMAPFVGLFDCDVIIFDFPGIGHQNTTCHNPCTWKLNPFKASFAILDSSKITLGKTEHTTVIDIVDECKTLKKYKQVVGLGVCYAAVVFLKAQAAYKKDTEKNLFDKMICDGTWVSLSQAAKNLTDQLLGWYHARWLKNFPFLIKTGTKMFELATGVSLKENTLNVADYFKHIDVPLLLFHGKHDTQIPLDDFVKIWELAQDAKDTIAIVSEQKHVKTHFYQPELYKILCELFLDLDYTSYVKHLQTPSLIRTHLYKAHEKNYHDYS